jgi:hypothetical protein
MKYFDWRIDSDKEVNNLLWLREGDDGSIAVIHETNGIWKLSKKDWQALNSSDPNVIANNSNDVTGTCLGRAAIEAWKANGSPTKTPEAPPSKEYLGNIFMAPLSVKAHLTHDKKCPTVNDLIEMGVEIAE